MLFHISHGISLPWLGFVIAAVAAATTAGVDDKQPLSEAFFPISFSPLQRVPLIIESRV